jgi:hypothetical protein
MAALFPARFLFASSLFGKMVGENHPVATRQIFGGRIVCSGDYRRYTELERSVFF